MGRLQPKPRSLAELTRQADDWNRFVPVGTDVEFHPVIGDPEHRVRKTRSAAFVLSGHTACVFLEGEAGCVAIDACRPVDPVEAS